MKRLMLVLILVELALSSANPVYADTIYIVQPGDTLFQIASRFGVSQTAIIAANGLPNPNRISVGQRLIIPAIGNVVENRVHLWN